VITRRRFVELTSLSIAGSYGFSSFGFASALSLPGLNSVSLGLRYLPPQWDGLTILQISDVHAGPYMDVPRMRRIRSLAASARADIVVFTGDQVDRRPEDADLFVEGFRGVTAPLGVYGILGNHDHFVDPAISVAALEGAGITPLVNDSVELARSGARLAVAGVDDLAASAGRAPDFKVLERHPGAFRLCLCHQPQGWQQAVDYGAHLTLAGHTHGGQIALTTRNLNVARFLTRYIAGPYRRDDSLLYVSRGVGVGTVPLRVGAPPEIDLITLRRTGSEARAAA